MRDSAGQVIIETEQASLTDAIQACDLSDSLIVRRGDIDSVWVDSGVAYLPPKSGIETQFSFGLDLVFYDTQ